jgi:diaminobutyrate-2-oxoglutarate transaminase
VADASSGLKPPAAFIVEPVQAEGGVNVASEAWLRKVQNIAHECGALFIVDDIQAACGRTGSYFSFDGMDIQPDIICLAKGVGGFGTAMAMNLVNPEHDKHWKPGEHTGTFRGQGLSFVSGREALTYFEDDSLMKEVRTKGERMCDFLKGIAQKFPQRNFDVRGKGMMQGLDVGDGALAKAVTARCFENGLLLWPCGTEGRVLKLIPPLTIPEDDLEQGLKIFSEAIILELGAA